MTADELLDRCISMTGGDAAASSLLEKVIQGTPGGKGRFIGQALESRIATVREVLPEGLRAEAPRLVKRAHMYFMGKPDLQECPAADFVRIVVEAASLGLMLDGRLAHVVRFKKQFQLMPDYKGLIAVAKRTGQIVDLEADVVCEKDVFHLEREDGRTRFLHQPAPLGQPRGPVVGAYCRLFLPGGAWKVVAMDKAELDKVRRAAPSQNGPWSSWETEMQKKTVCKRALKLYADDAGLIAVLDLDDRAEPEEAPEPAGLPLGRGSLRRPRVETPAAEEPDREQMERQALFDEVSLMIGGAEGEGDLSRCLDAVNDAAGVLGKEMAQALLEKLAVRRGQLS